MTRLRTALLPCLALTVAACYHQVVRTELPPSPTVIERKWVPTWIFGLVAAKPIDFRQQCPSGAAVVETQQTFLNGLVGLVTIGIYTPQSVRVTCASGAGSAPDSAAVIDRGPGAAPAAGPAGHDRAAAARY
jgi:hypothetical protein